MKLLRSPPEHQPLAAVLACKQEDSKARQSLHDYAREVFIQEGFFVLHYVPMLQFAHHIDLFLGSLQGGQHIVSIANFKCCIPVSVWFRVQVDTCRINWQALHDPPARPINDVKS
jgi:hypothetical protein